jgi:hypothetical protein
MGQVSAEPGELVFRSHDPHDGTNVEILSAAPVVWVSVAFMAMALFDGLPNVVLSHYDGAELLTITARNRTVVYRVGRYDHDRQAYLCNWPD